MPDQSCSCCKALWVKFCLTQDLTSSDASATAVVCVVGTERQFWQGEDPDPNNVGFAVYNLEKSTFDPGAYRFSGNAGDVGIACLDESLPDSDRYRIVSLSLSASQSTCCKCRKWQTVFYHLQQISVSEGDVLKLGDQIGEVGDAGDPGDPHLHYEARFDATDLTDGQSFDLSDIHPFPRVGTRAGGTSPGAQSATGAEIAYAKSRMTALPISSDYCTWYDKLGSSAHDGTQYWAKDLYCVNNSQEGATVTNFVDALTVVIAVDNSSGGVLLEHYCDECVVFKNTSGETVPAHGVMRVVSGTTAGERTLFTIDKPSDTFKRNYLVNGKDDVESDKIGCGSWLEKAGPVLYDDGQTPGIDESWGAMEDSWKLWRYRPGFTMKGGAIGSDDTARFSAIQYQVNNLKCKPDGDIDKGATGTVTVWMRDEDTGDWEASEYSLTVRALGSDLVADLFATLEWDCGEWIAGPMECDSQ